MLKLPTMRPRRTIGRPGASARAAYRTQRVRIIALPWTAKLLYTAGFGLAGVIWALLIGANPISGLIVGLGLALTVGLLLLAPEPVILGAILATFIGFSVKLAAAFVAAATETAYFSLGDAVGGAISLSGAGILATWITVKFSRGRRWLTLLLTLFGIVPAGFLLVTVVPGMGLYAAYLAMALVLMARCGTWGWVQGLAGLAIARLRARFARDRDRVPVPPRNSALAGWLRRAEAEQRTAVALETLDEHHTILHDVKVGRHPNALAHVVIGPAGIFLIASVSTAGAITETASGGVQIEGLPLGVVTSTLLEQRRIVARKLKVRERDLSMLIVVHPQGAAEVAPDVRRKLAIFAANDGDLPSAHVLLLGAEMVSAEINSGILMMSALACQAASWRARLRLVPAGAPVPSRWEPTEPVQVATVSEDGSTRRPSPAPAEELAEPALGDELDLFSWVESGVAVDVATSSGDILRGLRITGDLFRDANGALVVPVCVEKEWKAALRADRAPEAYPWPVISLARAL